MTRKLICAVGAGLLLGASYVGAAARNGLVSGALSAASLAPMTVASKSSSASSSAAAPAHAPAARSWNSNARRSSAPAFVNHGSGAAARAAPRTAAPFSASQGSNFTGGTARFVRPPVRFARRHIPIRLLTPLFIGSSYYYAYRYLPYDGPVCGGVTENGCELRWMDVPTEDSDESMPQCVEFCPQQQ